MPFALLKYALAKEHPDDPHFRWSPELKSSYDVIVIGAGGHGLAIAYYLAAQHGIKNVCVLDKGWLAGGNTARNTTIIRANYLTPEGVQFYKESVDLWRGLSNDLDINMMYSERGHFTLAHTDAAMRTARWRAEVNKHLGVNSEVIGPDEVKRLCPTINIADDVRYPILGALYHPPGAIARHDAVAWGYAKEAIKRGVEVHTQTGVNRILIENGRAVGVETSRGVIRAGKIVQAVAGASSEVARMAGFLLPIRTIPLPASHGEPGARGIVDAAVGRGQRREDGADEQEHHQPQRAGEPRRVEQRRDRLTQILPRHQADADVPGHRRRHEQRDHAGHRAERQRARRRANLFGRLRRALDAEVEPQAEVQRRDDAEPAVGQPGEQLRRLEDVVGPRANGREQHDDGEAGDGGDDEAEGERREHAAVVEPRQRDDGEHDERLVVHVLRSPPCRPPPARGSRR